MDFGLAVGPIPNPTQIATPTRLGPTRASPRTAPRFASAAAPPRRSLRPIPSARKALYTPRPLTPSQPEWRNW
jgi:hypothetical protein